MVNGSCTSRPPQEPSHASEYHLDRPRTQHPARLLSPPPDPALRLRAHIVLLLADGYTWAFIVAALYTSSRTIARWQARFLEGRAAALLGHTPGPQPGLADRW